MSQKRKQSLPEDTGKATSNREKLKRNDIFKILEENKDILRGFGVRKLGLFGSFARDDATPESDIDFIVKFEVKSFDAYVKLKYFLEDLFCRKVDLVTTDAIRPKLRPFIEKEVIYATGL